MKRNRIYRLFFSPLDQISLKAIKQLSGEHVVGKTSVFKCSL